MLALRAFLHLLACSQCRDTLYVRKPRYRRTPA